MSAPCEQGNTIKEIERRLSNGEVIFAEIAKDLKSHTEILTRIETQTVKTNGRVSKLEEKDIEARVDAARRDAVSKHAYTGMKLVRDISIGFATLGTLLAGFKEMVP